MYLTNRAVLFGGIAMLLLAVALVLQFVTGAAGMSDNDPFRDKEIAEYLRDVDDKAGLFIAQGAIGIIIDGVISAAVASAIYILFRDRSRLLALLAFGGILVGAAVSLVVDGSNVLQTVIAQDFVEGGPNGLAAGDPAALEAGRVLAMMSIAFTQIASTAIALGVGSLGVILVFAPAGAVNPPRWLGWVAILSAVAGWLGWFIVLTDAAFVFFIISGLSSLVLLVGLGGWLVAHRDQEPAAVSTAPA